MFTEMRHRPKTGQTRDCQREVSSKDETWYTYIPPKLQHERQQKVLEAAKVKAMKETGSFSEFRSAVLVSKVDQENRALLQMSKKRAQEERAERLGACEYAGGMLAKPEAVIRAEQERKSTFQRHQLSANDFNKEQVERKERENRQRLQQLKEEGEEERVKLVKELRQATEKSRKQKIARIEASAAYSREIRDSRLLAERQKKQDKMFEERIDQLCPEANVSYKGFVQEEIDKAKVENRIMFPLLATKQRQETKTDRVQFYRAGQCDVVPRLDTAETRKRRDLERKHVGFAEDSQREEATDDRVYFYMGGKRNAVPRMSTEESRKRRAIERQHVRFDEDAQRDGERDDRVYFMSGGQRKVMPRMSTQESRQRKDRERQHVDFIRDGQSSEAKDDDDRVYFYRAGQRDVVPRVGTEESRRRKDIERQHVGFDQNVQCNNKLYFQSADKWKLMPKLGSTPESSKIKEKIERQHITVTKIDGKCSRNTSIKYPEKSKVTEDSRQFENGPSVSRCTTSVALHAAHSVSPKAKREDEKLPPINPSKNQILPNKPSIQKVIPKATREKLVLPPIIPKNAHTTRQITADNSSNPFGNFTSVVLPSDVHFPLKATPIYHPERGDTHRPNPSLKISYNYPKRSSARISRPVSPEFRF